MNYQIDCTETDYLDKPGNTIRSLLIDYVQSRKATKQEYAIDSLDLILGFVGGLSAVIFYLMELVLGNFEDFKVHSMHLGSFYGTNSSIRKQSDEAHHLKKSSEE